MAKSKIEKKIDAAKSMEKVKLIEKASKMIVEDYYKQESTPDGAVPPDVDMSRVKQIVMEDEEVRGFIGTQVDAISASGFSLMGAVTKIKSDEKILQAIRFRQHKKKMDTNLLSYNHCFVELIPSKGTKSRPPKSRKIVDLKVWTPNYIKPIMTPHGDTTGWEYSLPNSIPTTNGEERTQKWLLDEMVHINIDHIGDGFWSVPQLITLNRLITLKWNIISHIEWLFDTNQYRHHMHGKNLAPDDVKHLTNLLKEGMAQRDKFLVTVGSEDMTTKQIASPADLPYYLEVLNHIRNRMLTILRLPPIIAGTVDNSNRSNSDVQARFTFTNRIKSYTNDMEDELILELFPKLGISSKLVHNAIDIKNKRELVDIAILMITNGADHKMTLEWLNKYGLDLPNGLFANMLKMQNEVKNGLPENSNLFKSREKQDNFGKSDYGIKK